MQCSKKAYPTSKDAVASLRTLKRKRRKMFQKRGIWHRTPVRTYQCEHCGLWHLTSQYQNERTTL